ncbi:MAG: hypothetical protein ABII01_05965 [Candidatus Woesearchaeota archaeon]
MMLKKAQNTTEYLIMLAIVIIIAVIVIAVMSFVPSLGSKTSPRGVRIYWDSAEIGMTD